MSAPLGQDARMEPINLARKPFANGRPVVRISLLLVVIGALLLVSNVAAYRRYLVGSAEKRAELATARAELSRVEQREGDLARELSGFDLERQNRQVAYLNRRIAERTFGWSTLLDRLGHLLPNDVRLRLLRPQVGDRNRRRETESTAASVAERVRMEITGEAKNDEALLRFVDNLFGHPAFSEPNLKTEQRNDAGLIEFSLAVDYLPKAADPGEAAAPTAPAAGASVGSAGGAQ